MQEMIPEGWSTYKAGEIIKLRSGESKPVDFSKEHTEIHIHPVYGGNGVMGYSSHYNSEQYNIIIGRVGEYCGVTRLVNGKKWITDNAIYSKCINKKIDILYLYYNFSFYNISRLRSKGGQPLISQKPIYAVTLLIPPLSEQKRIAEVLSTWDRAIETAEKLITNGESLKKALMQQLLTGKKRLLSDNEKKFSGKWRKRKLGACIREIKKTKEPKPNLIELLTVKLHNKGVIRSGKFPNPTENGRAYHKRYKGELIIGRQNLHNGGVAIIPEECDGLITSNALSSFKVIESTYIKFVLLIMNTAHFKFSILNLASGTGQKEISIKKLLKIYISTPTNEEQKKISSVFSDFDREINALQQKINFLKKEKIALMQQLLTGKRRVNINGEEAAYA